MENNEKPAYLVRDKPRSEDYNLGVMDALQWARHELGHKDLPVQSVRYIKSLMDSVISDCQARRLTDFEDRVVPIRVEQERIDTLVDGCEFEEVHIKK